MTSEITNLSSKRTSYIEIYSFSNGGPTIKFPAFLTDFSDSYKSQFSSESVYEGIRSQQKAKGSSIEPKQQPLPSYQQYQKERETLKQ